MKIGIDIDNVLAHTFRDLNAQFNLYMGKELSPIEIVRTMREDRIRMIGYWYHTWKNRLMTAVAPIEGAADTLAKWHGKHELHLVTSRIPLFNRQTKEWLKEHRFAYHQLHHARERTKYQKAPGCEIFIEDNLDECEVLADHCLRVYLIDQPWNRRPIKKDNIVRVDSINALANTF